MPISNLNALRKIFPKAQFEDSMNFYMEELLSHMDVRSAYFNQPWISNRNNQDSQERENSNDTIDFLRISPIIYRFHQEKSYCLSKEQISIGKRGNIYFKPKTSLQLNIKVSRNYEYNIISVL